MQSTISVFSKVLKLFEYTIIFSASFMKLGGGGGGGKICDFMYAALDDEALRNAIHSERK